MTITSTDTYNYVAFDFALEQAEFTHWRQAGPTIGEDAPDPERRIRASTRVRTTAWPNNARRRTSWRWKKH